MVTTVGVIGLEDQNPGELALGAGRWLERYRVKSRDFAQIALQFVHQAQHALGHIGWLERVRIGKAGHAGRFFVDFGVVLHGT
jgi:hypothetical protein